MSKYEFSIRCYFGGAPDNYTQHYPEIKLTEIPKWIEAYEFTHSNVQSISVKVWIRRGDEE